MRKLYTLEKHFEDVAKFGQGGVPKKVPCSKILKRKPLYRTLIPARILGYNLNSGTIHGQRSKLMGKAISLKNYCRVLSRGYQLNIVKGPVIKNDKCTPIERIC